jgi:predicted amidohydrolase
LHGLETGVTVLVVLLVAGIDSAIWFQKPTGSLTVAAAGWVFDDTSHTMNPNGSPGFEKLFAEPAQEAAAQGARIFTTGELGFYIADHEREERIEQFRPPHRARVSLRRENWVFILPTTSVKSGLNSLPKLPAIIPCGLWLGITMSVSPEGEVVDEYTKTYLTPFEPGHKGDGVLKTFEVDGLTVGAMICQDDNFSKLTRYYGDLKADILLCPTADWWTIKDAHLQAVRARTIECGYGIARGAACGISAAISHRGQVLAEHDHYKNGPGYVVADIPVLRGKTIFSRYGHWPSLVAAAACIICIKIRNHK